MSLIDRRTIGSIVESTQLRIRQEASRPLALGSGVLTSQSFRYPLTGISYFWNHPRLWPYILNNLVPTVLIRLSALLFVLGVVYPANLTAATLCTGPIGVITATLTIWNIASRVAEFVLSNYIIPDQMDKIFDYVLCNEGLELEVYSGRLRRITRKPMGKYVQEAAIYGVPYGVVTFPVQAMRVIRNNWFTVIPLFGPLFSFTQMAKSSAIGRHQRYYTLMRMKAPNVKYFVKEREAEYVSFGVAAAIFEAIPFLGLVFNFTNHAAAALLAVDFHREASRGVSKPDPEAPAPTEPNVPEKPKEPVEPDETAQPLVPETGGDQASPATIALPPDEE